MALDPFLLDILVCPDDKGPLAYLPDEARLYNPRLRRSYPIHDGIPVMLVDESEPVDDAEHARLMDVVRAGVRMTGPPPDAGPPDGEGR